MLGTALNRAPWNERQPQATGAVASLSGASLNDKPSMSDAGGVNDGVIGVEESGEQTDSMEETPTHKR